MKLSQQSPFRPVTAIFRAHPPILPLVLPALSSEKAAILVIKGPQGRLRTQTRTVDVKMLFNIVSRTPRFESLRFMLKRINPEK